MITRFYEAPSPSEQILDVALSERFHACDAFPVSVCQAGGNTLVTECYVKQQSISHCEPGSGTRDSLCRHEARILVLKRR